MTERRNSFFLMVIALLALLLLLYPRHEPPAAEGTLPSRLSNQEFWRIVQEFSETGGTFRSDNFVSNETAFQHVIPALRETAKAGGGAYIGVGPDQNFTYIVALQPALAFIVDIRRQNMLQHLMYKALIEMSNNRTEFLSNLFSRPVPMDFDEAETLERLFEALHAATGDELLFEQNLAAILDELRVRRQFNLEPGDVETIEYVYRNFLNEGPDIRYSSPNRWSPRRFPSYSDLMLETDQLGYNHSYVASEEHFQRLKRMHSNNLIVPLVGDFAGRKTLAALGTYLKQHGAVVSAFYTSNVEFYLFQSDDWIRYYTNIAELPLDQHSTFIRAFFNNFGMLLLNQNAGPRSITLLDNMPGLLTTFRQGRIRSYGDVIRRSQ